MNEILVTIAFIFVIALLLFDRYLTSQQHAKEKDKLLEELSRATKAVISKNATEYVMTTSIDKVPEQKEPVEEEKEEDVSSLSDDEFDEFIDKQNGKTPAKK